MDGKFDFDVTGRATVIEAPRWAIEALAEVQGKVDEVRQVASDQSVSADDVRKQISELTELIKQQAKNQDALVRHLNAVLEKQLADDAKDASPKGKTRHRLRAGLGTLADAIQVAGGLVYAGKLAGDKVWPYILDLVSRLH